MRNSVFDPGVVRKVDTFDWLDDVLPVSLGADGVPEVWEVADDDAGGHREVVDVDDLAELNPELNR
jgi:hypothetical protein